MKKVLNSGKDFLKKLGTGALTVAVLATGTGKALAENIEKNPDLDPYKLELFKLKETLAVEPLTDRVKGISVVEETGGPGDPEKLDSLNLGEGILRFRKYFEIYEGGSYKEQFDTLISQMSDKERYVMEAICIFVMEENTIPDELKYAIVVLHSAKYFKPAKGEAVGPFGHKMTDMKAVYMQVKQDEELYKIYVILGGERALAGEDFEIKEIEKRIAEALKEYEELQKESEKRDKESEKRDKESEKRRKEREKRDKKLKQSENRLKLLQGIQNKIDMAH